ncbi:MAG: YggT family protein [Sphingomonas sp.]|uniref:YggT family protein n=1 Tax=Sphingomonas sp. TaxID=28214 RepID=UPI000DB4D5B3|nr:osmotic-shock protein [Zymomonas sp.]MBA4041100.1 osmotic-shock protein [Sphingobium sp.]MBA4772547.1 YggT family protein [Sphingomonas sp.]PZP19253.1 MAG: osmotic-shock protein [Sphingomonas hengshuiensis]
MLTLIQIAQVLLSVLSMIILAQFVLSLLIAFNVVNTYNDFVRQFYNGLNQITEPLYRPIRRILPDFGQLDFSPMVVLLLIRIAGLVLDNVALTIATGRPL